jgi:hypothetical protein
MDKFVQLLELGLFSIELHVGLQNWLLDKSEANLQNVREHFKTVQVKLYELTGSQMHKKKVELLMSAIGGGEETLPFIYSELMGVRVQQYQKSVPYCVCAATLIRGIVQILHQISIMDLPTQSTD